MAKTGKPMLDGIGSTEMLHIFITNRFDDHRPACTGRPIGGYEAKIVDGEMREVPRGEVGQLAVRGRPAAATSPTSASATMCGTAET